METKSFLCLSSAKPKIAGGSFRPANIEDIMEYLEGCLNNRALYPYSGYLQIPAAQRCKDMTTFTCKFGAIRFKFMLFGVMAALVTIHRMMNEMLGGILYANVYLADIIIISNYLARSFGEVWTFLKQMNREFSPFIVQLLGCNINRKVNSVDR